MVLMPSDYSDPKYAEDLMTASLAKWPGWDDDPDETSSACSPASPEPSAGPNQTECSDLEPGLTHVNATSRLFLRRSKR
jgi:hypothetical protein